MRFIRRLIEKKDLPWCAQILDDGFENRPKLKRCLPNLWTSLLGQGAITMMIIEDQVARCPVAFGARAIVSDEFAAAARQGVHPYLALSLMEQEAEKPSVHILRPDQIRERNHPGHRVNLMILHYSELVNSYSSDQRWQIRDSALRSLVELQSGFALKDVLFEFFGEDDLAYCLSIGLNLRSSYEEYFLSHPRPPREKRPFLVSLSLSEKDEKQGSPIASLFIYSRPYCFFTPAQQSILVRTLLNRSQAEISDDLTIMESTIKDHWKAIYDRVFEAQKDWPEHHKILPSARTPTKCETNGKMVPKNSTAITGTRLRSKLLRHLAQNPSELHPVNRKYFPDKDTFAS